MRRAIGLLLLLISCSPAPAPRPSTSYIPELPSPPPVDHVARMRVELAAVESSQGDDRLVHSEKLFNLIRRYRGELHLEMPAELSAVGSEIWSALSKESMDRVSAHWMMRAAGLCRQTPALVERAEKETDVETLCVLLDALGSTRDDRALATLIRSAGSEREPVRKFAVFNLGPFKDDAVPPLLRAALQDPSEEVRWYAAYGLGLHHKDRSGFEVLVRMIDRDHLRRILDPQATHSEVLTQRTILLALAALRNLGDPRALDPLRKTARTDPSPSIREACRETIRLLEGAP